MTSVESRASEFRQVEERQTTVRDASLNIMWIYLILATVGALLIRKLYRRTLMVENLHGRHVLITGCDHGFGRMLAEKLDEQGVQVFATCLHQSSVNDLMKKCTSNLKALVMDVTDEAQIKAAVAFAEEHLKEKALWCLVNNAGYLSPPVVFEMATKEDFREVMNVNLFGMVDVTRAFLPLLRRGEEGRIVNVSSMNGRIAVEASPYSCSKYGVESFSDGLSYSLSPFNISVHTIEPGYFRTDINDPEWEEKGIWKRWEILDDSIKAVYGRKFMEEYCHFVVNSVKTFASNDLKSVVRAMNHAVVGRHPKNRYVVGWDAMFIFRPVSMLPVSWAMSIMKLLGVSKAKPLGARR